MSSEPADLGESRTSGFYRCERRDSDLPFYRGTPSEIAPVGWLAILGAVAVGCAALLLTQPHLHEGLPAFIPPLLYVAIPLLMLAVVGGRRAPNALFRRLRPSDAAIILGFYFLNLIVTAVVGTVVTTFLDGTPNPVGGLVAGESVLNRVILFGWTALQLVGEEIFTILIFLAFLAFFDRRMGRRGAIALAALGASIIFALIHLPSYQWNLPQVLVGIAPIRIILLIPYILTRNLWVSAGVHILNDWTIFSLAILGTFAE